MPNMMDINELIFLKSFLKKSKKDNPVLKQPLSTCDFDFFSDNNNYQPKARKQSCSNNHNHFNLNRMRKKNYLPSSSKVFREIKHKKDFNINGYLNNETGSFRGGGNNLRTIPKLKNNINYLKSEDNKGYFVGSEISSNENIINENNNIMTTRSNSLFKELYEQKIKNVSYYFYNKNNNNQRFNNYRMIFKKFY